MQQNEIFVLTFDFVQTQFFFNDIIVSICDCVAAICEVTYERYEQTLVL